MVSCVWEQWEKYKLQSLGVVWEQMFVCLNGSAGNRGKEEDQRKEDDRRWKAEKQKGKERKKKGKTNQKQKKQKKSKKE